MANPRRPPPVDMWFMDLALQAAGHTCLCCGKPLKREDCSRGHIDKRKLDNSNNGPENIVPVHLSCNREHTQSLVMPVQIPPGYFERLRILILARVPVL